mmetsp:Transcript_12193/g.40676  ORF Transcript_12193/g.40676 Transcript_12193/m.40676 type:complete len:307 (+) Transcript_12193:559-1479(+)
MGGVSDEARARPKSWHGGETARAGRSTTPSRETRCAWPVAYDMTSSPEKTFLSDGGSASGVVCDSASASRVAKSADRAARSATDALAALGTALALAFAACGGENATSTVTTCFGGSVTIAPARRASPPTLNVAEVARTTENGPSVLRFKSMATSEQFRSMARRVAGATLVDGTLKRISADPSAPSFSSCSCGAATPARSRSRKALETPSSSRPADDLLPPEAWDRSASDRSACDTGERAPSAEASSETCLASGNHFASATSSARSSPVAAADSRKGDPFATAAAGSVSVKAASEWAETRSSAGSMT